jgi:DNA mismatch endonuclease (patch repair protein)
MADVFNKRARSRIMRAVRTAQTEPELLLVSALRKRGLRFRTNDQDIVGIPDICFRRLRLAVFVDGDYWHGRAWFESGRAPATNRRFWVSKFECNRTRDLEVTKALRIDGWSVLRLWGSDVKKSPDDAGLRVLARLRVVRRRRERTPRR